MGGRQECPERTFVSFQYDFGRCRDKDTEGRPSADTTCQEQVEGPGVVDGSTVFLGRHICSASVRSDALCYYSSFLLLVIWPGAPFGASDRSVRVAMPGAPSFVASSCYVRSSVAPVVTLDAVPQVCMLRLRTPTGGSLAPLRPRDREGMRVHLVRDSWFFDRDGR